MLICKYTSLTILSHIIYVKTWILRNIQSPIFWRKINVTVPNLYHIYIVAMWTPKKFQVSILKIAWVIVNYRNWICPNIFSFFRSFFYRLGSILRNSKNDLNKVPTRSTLLPETYPIRDNRSIISGRKSVFFHKKKYTHHCKNNRFFASLRI